MTRLIDLGKAVTEDKESVHVTEPAGSAAATTRVIDSLRHRLVCADFHDSVETKSMLLAELVYRCYLEIQKRRFL